LSIPAFLLPETTIDADGSGPQLDLGEDAGGVLITLGVSAVIEQESLLIAIHGSQDGAEWSPEPLVQFSQKFYTGVSAVFLDARRRSVRFLQARWKTDRWGRGTKTPMFRIYLLADPISD
jgi:hypothetical protein